MERMHMKWSGVAMMAVAMFVVMYGLMYLMVDSLGNVYANINQLYMTLAMTGAMMLVEVAVMGSMYQKGMKMIVVGVSAIVLIASVAGVRGQLLVSDKDFLESMIPHHGAALLMCKKANLQDQQIKELCNRIVAGQQSEINWMQAKLSKFK